MDGRILLVEGADDQHVLWNLFEVRQVSQCFAVERPSEATGADETDGIDGLLDSIPARLTTTEVERLAVVVDADMAGPAARWRAVRHRLEAAGYENVPADYSSDGMVFDLSLERQTPRSIRFGLWVMPDNESEGMLEDFVVRMIDEQDAMLPRVDGFIESILESTLEEERRFSLAHRAKARLHTWLAVSERPGRPMGQAITADSHLDANHASVAPFLSWVTRALVD